MTISLLSLNMPSVDKNAEELEFSYPMEGNVIWSIIKSIMAILCTVEDV